MDANNTIDSTGDHPIVAMLPDDWEKHHFLITDGKVKKLTRSAAYIIDMLTKDR